MYRKWTTFKWNCLGCLHHISSQCFSLAVFTFPIHGCRVRFLVWSLCCHCVQVATSIQNRVLRVCSHPLFNVHLEFVAKEPEATSTRAICSPGDVIALLHAGAPDSMQPHAQGHFKQRSHPVSPCTGRTSVFHDKSVEYSILHKNAEKVKLDTGNGPVYSTKAVCPLV